MAKIVKPVKVNSRPISRVKNVTTNGKGVKVRKK